MSEQSPWGTPPPGGTPGPYQGGPPYQSQRPPDQPPHQPPGGWGAPPSYGGPSGPGGHQGPRRGRGLVLGILAAVVVVIAAFAVTLFVTTSDDDPDESASDDTSETTSETTGETSSPTEDTTSDAPPAGDGIAGEGYTFSLPGVGWNDATEEAADRFGGAIDTVIVLGESFDLAQSNILVEALSAGAASSPEDLEGLWKRNLSSTDNATPVDIDDIEIDGERAIGVRIDDRLNTAGDPIKQIAYFVLHDERQYSITLSFPAEGDVVSEGDFALVLESWAWSS